MIHVDVVKLININYNLNQKIIIKMASSTISKIITNLKSEKFDILESPGFLVLDDIKNQDCEILKQIREKNSNYFNNNLLSHYLNVIFYCYNCCSLSTNTVWKSIIDELIVNIKNGKEIKPVIIWASNLVRNTKQLSGIIYPTSSNYSYYQHILFIEMKLEILQEFL